MEVNSEQDLIEAMVAASGKVRHPALPLTRFVSSDYDDVLDEHDDEEEALANLPASEVELARARRGSVIIAAEQIIDECIQDLQEIEFSDGMPDPDRAEESFVYSYFPERHRRAYNQWFYRKVLVTAIKVAYDLANPEGPLAACTAEEIIRHSIGEIANSLCALAELDRPNLYLDDALLEDIDFETLFDHDMDGIEDDPARQATMMIDVPRVENWFSPFNTDDVVHPYAETQPTKSPAIHDLFVHVTESDARHSILDSPTINSPDPLAGLEAASSVVALARAAARGTEPANWIPDDADPEGSFANLVATSRLAAGGSGWLTWEPYEGADVVRTDPVVSLTPHRHFPVGTDQPWIWAAVGGGRMFAIPLSVVVSYRPDPDVQRRWNHAFVPSDNADGG